MRAGKALVGRFSDGEVQVEIEENVRGRAAFVVQPTCAPTAENFMELLVLIDALKRASAASVTAVVPHFGYARQRSEEHTSELQSLMRISYSVFCLKKNIKPQYPKHPTQ